MQVLAATLEQRLLCRISDQRVLEPVSGLRSNATHVEQLRVGQITQGALEILFGNRMDRGAAIGLAAGAFGLAGP